jgi:hypothetical protein
VEVHLSWLEDRAPGERVSSESNEASRRQLTAPGWQSNKSRQERNDQEPR